MNKIKEEQLNTIQKQQKEANDFFTNIGYLETQKHNLLHKLSELTKEIDLFKVEMENEYGQVNINIETGEYKPLEEKAQPELKVVENVE